MIAASNRIRAAAPSARSEQEVRASPYPASRNRGVSRQRSRPPRISSRCSFPTSEANMPTPAAGRLDAQESKQASRSRVSNGAPSGACLCGHICEDRADCRSRHEGVTYASGGQHGGFPQRRSTIASGDGRARSAHRNRSMAFTVGPRWGRSGSHRRQRRADHVAAGGQSSPETRSPHIGTKQSFALLSRPHSPVSNLFRVPVSAGGPYGTSRAIVWRSDLGGGVSRHEPPPQRCLRRRVRRTVACQHTDPIPPADDSIEKLRQFAAVPGGLVGTANGAGSTSTQAGESGVPGRHEHPVSSTISAASPTS